MVEKQISDREGVIWVECLTCMAYATSLSHLWQKLHNQTITFILVVDSHLFACQPHLHSEPRSCAGVSLTVAG